MQGFTIYTLYIYTTYTCMHACMLYFHVCPCISLKGHDRYIARYVICECCPKSSLWLRETRFNWMYCSLSLEPMSDDVRCPRQETMELCFHASPWHRNSLFAWTIPFFPVESDVLNTFTSATWQTAHGHRCGHGCGFWFPTFKADTACPSRSSTW